MENQATDRAFRIGQTKDVHVHKLICAGTLEDRIDLMIEIKQETADQVVGATSGTVAHRALQRRAPGRAGPQRSLRRLTADSPRSNVNCSDVDKERR